MRILWFPMSNLQAPSARTRSHAIARELKRRGLQVRMCGHPRWSRWPNRLRKFVELARCLPFCDVVVFQKTAHWSTHAAMRAAHALGKRVVFDVDDAAHLWREGTWVKRFLREADVVVAGSHALLDIAAASQARRSVWIPTGVEIERYPRHQVRADADPFVVGWIGTPANVPALELVRQALAEFAKERRVVLRIVTDPRHLRFEAPAGIDLEMVTWELEGAGTHVASFDVGIMPIADDEAARCKCAFKALEFMACGVPALVSDVGENRVVIQHGSNGMRAQTSDEWLAALRLLAARPRLREQLGQAGRETVLQTYTTERSATAWLELLDSMDAPRASKEPMGSTISRRLT